MAIIFVTRGIILKNGCVLAAQRTADMSLPLKWELPGGKLEVDETPEAALVREIMEEMGVVSTPFQALPFVDRAFQGRHYRMLPYLCSLDAGEPQPFEHAALHWQPLSQLFELDWAPGEQNLLGKWMAWEEERAADVVWQPSLV